MWRLRMNLTPFSRALNSSGLASAAPLVQTPLLATIVPSSMNRGAKWLARQQEEVAKRVAQADVVISTALIPGRPAPRLVTEDMVRSMKTGAVVIDLAAAAGGNCALTERDRTASYFTSG